MPSRRNNGSTSCRIIGILSGKGGAAKTTTALALAAIAVARGHRVVLIDTDPMGSATFASGLDPLALNPALRDVLTGAAKATAALYEANDGFRVMPATPALQREEQGAPKTLSRAIEGLDASVIIFDTPPGFGPFSQAVAAFSTELIVPIQAEPLATRTGEYVLGLLDGVAGARDRLRGFVPTIYDGRRVLTGDQMAELLNLGAPLLTPIPRAVSAAEAPLAGRSVVTYNPKSPASLAYGKLAEALRL
jgi:chromosome partitioning protein